MKAMSSHHHQGGFYSPLFFFKRRGIYYKLAAEFLIKNPIKTNISGVYIVSSLCIMRSVRKLYVRTAHLLR